MPVQTRQGREICGVQALATRSVQKERQLRISTRVGAFSCYCWMRPFHYGNSNSILFCFVLFYFMVRLPFVSIQIRLVEDAALSLFRQLRAMLQRGLSVSAPESRRQDQRLRVLRSRILQAWA